MIGSVPREFRLMGGNPEHRFHLIQTRAGELDPEMIDA